MKNNRLSAVVLTIVFALLFLPVYTQKPAAEPTPFMVSIDPASFDKYVGQYEDAHRNKGTVVSIFREGGKYFLQVSNQDRLEILPSHNHTFFAKENARITVGFTFDMGSRIGGLVWRQNQLGGLEFFAIKIADQPAKDTRVAFKRTEAMIPMRDGVKLFTVIFTPEAEGEPLPILMNRTPYSVKNWSSAAVNGSRPELVKDGYIFVFQDIRGRHESEGVFEMMRPPRDKNDAKSIDESTDTYDTIDYLIKNVPKNNGKVGIAGVSYDGWTAAVALMDPHPALKASSPQAPVTDLWMGDDFMHHGAFRQTYAYEWAVPLESAKSGGQITFDKEDMYDWYLDLNRLPTLAQDLAKKSHSWKAFIEHPSWDAYWQKRAANLYLKETSVPTMVVGGWWDQEDLYGPLALYQALEKTDKDNQVFLVMGPWNHGGWGGRARRLGAVDFGSDTGRHFKDEIQAPFFAYHLKGKGTLKMPEATIFQSGSNRWMQYNSWPSKAAAVQQRGLYLQADGKLSFDKPAAAKTDGYDEYSSDPRDPVPYRKRPVLATYGRGSSWFTWLVDDQSFLADRKDVLSWRTEPLTEDVTITGNVMANLFASTSGTDSDWAVKLIDVYPAEPADPKMANYQLMVAAENFRGRYRESFETARPLKPNTPLPYKIDLRGQDYTFKKGHRIMVQIQSSWFPLYDRNPQKFVPNIFLAKEGDFQTATQRVYRSAKYPTHISVSVAQ